MFFVFDNHRTITQTSHIDLRYDFMGDTLGFPSPPRNNKERNVIKKILYHYAHSFEGKHIICFAELTR
jgi:hypothetical protein